MKKQKKDHFEIIKNISIKNKNLATEKEPIKTKHQIEAVFGTGHRIRLSFVRGKLHINAISPSTKLASQRMILIPLVSNVVQIGFADVD